MKINAVKTLRLKEHPNLIRVRIHTDSGLTGLGETYFGASPVEADIHDRIASLIYKNQTTVATNTSHGKPCPSRLYGRLTGLRWRRDSWHPATIHAQMTDCLQQN